MTLEGLEVLFTAPDFATSPKLVGNYRFDELAIAQAKRLHFYPADRPLHGMTHRFVFANRDDAKDFEDFFYDLAGKWKPFWLPSWHAELAPTADIANGSTSITIASVNYGSVYDPTDANVAKLGHYIFILDQDGTFLIRKVASAATVGGNDILTITSAVTKAFTLGRFFIGFVYCVTSLSDALKLDFSNQIASCELAVTEEPFIDEASAETETTTPDDFLTANFTADPYSGEAPLEVDFTDTSEGSPVAWLWSFGDGSATSTTQNPTHTFTNSGIYLVRLTVTNADGFQTSINKFITVTTDPDPPAESLGAAFSADPTSGDSVLDVDFTDESTGTPNGWLWNFGDGTGLSSLQNPSHSYNLPGVYTVTLTVRDLTGAESIATGLITVTEPTPEPVTCDAMETYYGWWSSGPFGCSTCCTLLDSMAVDDTNVWDRTALENCLGLTVVDGMVFDYDSKTFGVSYSEIQNTGGSLNALGAEFYDVVRIT